MKKMVAVPVTAPDLDAEVGSRFGRTQHFLLVDPATMAWRAVANPGSRAGGGAGVQTAQFLAEEGVDAVIGVDFGPNAQEALRMAGIAMYHCSSGATVRGAVERLDKDDDAGTERRSDDSRGGMGGGGRGSGARSGGRGR